MFGPEVPLYLIIGEYHAWVALFIAVLCFVVCFAYHARGFIIDEPSKDMLNPGDPSAPPDFVLIVLLGILITIGIIILWSLIYIIGIPIGVCFGLRSLCRKYKADKKLVQDDNKKTTDTMAEMIHDHERKHHVH